MEDNDEVIPGDLIRYWVPWGSLAGQCGTVKSVKKLLDTDYAEIEGKGETLWLFRGAIWGFESLRD